MWEYITWIPFELLLPFIGAGIYGLVSRLYSMVSGRNLSPYEKVMVSEILNAMLKSLLNCISEGDKHERRTYLQQLLLLAESREGNSKCSVKEKDIIKR